MAVELRRAAAAALIAALTDRGAQPRHDLSAGRAIATGLVLGTLGRVAARWGAGALRTKLQADHEAAPRPRSGGAMTRSEEELSVRTVRRQRGRVRLRKHVVTEEVQRTIPVRREELSVEELPSRDGDADAAGEPSSGAEGVDEIVLYEEVPVIDTRVVPRELVRVVKTTRADEAHVVDEVRKEQIDLERQAPRSSGDVTRAGPGERRPT